MSEKELLLSHQLNLPLVLTNSILTSGHGKRLNTVVYMEVNATVERRFHWQQRVDNGGSDTSTMCFFYIQDSIGHIFELTGHLPKGNPCYQKNPHKTTNQNQNQKDKQKCSREKVLTLYTFTLLVNTTLFNQALLPSSNIERDFKGLVNTTFPLGP